MQINADKQLISMTEANQNFSKVARLVEENGSAVILKNNQPKFVVMNYDSFKAYQQREDEQLNSIADRIINEHLEAFKELAK